jgi:hypothetical protein
VDGNASLRVTGRYRVTGRKGNEDIREGRGMKVINIATTTIR